MAFAFKVGGFTSSGSSGNQTVSGVGFTPKALILFGTNAAGVNTFAVMHFGAAVVGQQRWTEMRSNHGATAADSAVANDNSTIYHRAGFSGSLVGPSGTFVSFNSDGFVINWSVGHTAFPLKYICFGGADLTDVDLRTVTVPGATGTQNVTGVGFQPDALLAFGISHTAANTGRDTDPISHFIGFSDGVAQGVNSFASDEGADPTNTVSWPRDDRLILTLNGATSAVHNEASLTSLDADGFTLNWITRNSSDVFFVLSLRGGSYKVGFAPFKTSTGTEAVTGVGFQPVGVIIMTDGNEAATP